VRLDWTYLLGLRVGDPGFDHTVLTARLLPARHGASLRLSSSGPSQKSIT